MVAGLVTGMGYLGYAVLFSVILGLATYHICLKDAAKEKEFIDTLRCRNGNIAASTLSLYFS